MDAVNFNDAWKSKKDLEAELEHKKAYRISHTSFTYLAFPAEVSSTWFFLTSLHAATDARLASSTVDIAHEISPFISAQ